jgi:ADP-heptose:LPS heptosyltransferase
MERFTDQPLRKSPHLAVFGSDKVGNFVVTTPLLRGLKEKYPGAQLTFFGSTTTADLESACPYIDANLALYGAGGDILGEFAAFVAARTAAFGPIDLAINCDGFSPLTQALVPLTRPRYAAGQVLRADLRLPLAFEKSDPRAAILADPDWNGPEMVARHPLLSSNYFGELLCRIAYVETDFFHVEVGTEPPPFDVPDVLVHMTSTNRARMWLAEHWKTVLHWCDVRGVSIGLVGSPPDVERDLYGGGGFEEELLRETGLIDLRGRTKLTQLAGAFSRARAAVVVNSGPMHLSVASGCPTVILHGNDEGGYGASPVRLWGPRAASALPVLSEYTCTVCSDNRYRLTACQIDGHPCMREMRPEAVISALERALGK